jgi:hypothetical protein
LCAFLFYQKTKKPFAPQTAKSHSPQENIWLALSESKEKAAQTGDKFQKSLLLARFYARARTHFSAKV